MPLQAKIGQLLLILLHCAMIRQEASADLDFALVHGLKLAEGGKTLRDRRIGMYPAENSMRTADHQAISSCASAYL